MDHDIAEALSHSALMAALTDRQRGQIASIAKTRSFGPGEVIVSEGSPGALAMWVVVEGRVAVTREGRRLNELGPGSHIGEIALLSSEGTTRSATITALEPTTVLQITRWDLVPMIKANPEIAQAFIEELARRLIAADARLVELTG